MTEYQEIIINWEKLILVNKLQGADFEKNNILYQIYGDHHIYGRNTLLYIGISKNCDIRLKQHLKGVFGYVNNLKISIGYLENFAESLEIPESILVANRKPSFNKEFLHNLPYEGKTKKIIVINNGSNEMLKTCCTNFWWVKSLAEERSKFNPLLT